MNTDKVRSIIAIIVVSCIMLVISLIALESVLFGSELNIDLLKTWSSLWTGVLGVILGYYFGKTKTDSDK